MAPKLSPALLTGHEAPETIQRMLFATWALLYSLSPEQRSAAVRPMDDPARLDWDFIPKPDRTGIPFAALSAHQRTLAHTLLAAGCSDRGYSQALSIMMMENALRQLERKNHDVLAGDFRNSDQYFFAFYGRPGFEDTWAWRLLGHHLSLSYTIVGGRYLTTTPCNMGAQPVGFGVLAPLREEENRAFHLLQALSPAQRSRAVIHHVAPADYVTRQVPKVGDLELPDYYDLGIEYYRITDDDRKILAFHRDQPAGIGGHELTEEQQAILTSVVDAYFSRLPEEYADKQRSLLSDAGPDGVYFCWAGQPGLDGSHYYRVQTDRILIEFDNAIDDGNHIHSVLRDLEHDLGSGLLEHYLGSPARDHLRNRLKSSSVDDEVNPAFPLADGSARP